MKPRPIGPAVIGGLAGAGLAAASAGAAAVLRQQRVRPAGRGRGRWTPIPTTRGLPEPVAADRVLRVQTSDGVDLRVEEVGPADAPLTVVFAHGYTLRSEVWLYQRNGLRERFGDDIRMVFYDHRSHGRSGASSQDNSTLWQLGRDLHRVIDAAAPDGPIVLVGHSMGGMTIMRLAEQAPELFRRRPGFPAPRVSAVALVNTSSGEMHDVALMGYRVIRFGGPIIGRVLRTGARLPNLVERGRVFGRDLANLLVERFAFASPNVDAAVVRFCADLIAQTHIEIVNGFFDTLMGHDGRLGLLNMIDQQVLIISADHDALTPMAHAEAIKMALPHSRLHVFERSGHMTMLEYPYQVNDDLIGLIAPALEAAIAGRPMKRVRPRRTRAARTPDGTPS